MTRSTKLFAIATIGCLLFFLIFYFLLKMKLSAEPVEAFTRYPAKAYPELLFQHDVTEDIFDISGCDSTGIYLRTSKPGKFIKAPFQGDSIEIIDCATVNPYFSTNKFHSHYLEGEMFFIATTAHNDFNHVLINNEPICHEVTLPNAISRTLLLKNDILIARGISGAGKTQTLQKINLKDGAALQEYSFHDDYQDAGLLQDGVFSYDPYTSTITYAFLYQNGFLSLDTNLKLKYAAKTIDQREGIGARVTKTGSAYTYEGVPERVTSMTTAFKGTLYIGSNIYASNDSLASGSGMLPIDTYALTTGQYKGSFYLKQDKGERIRKILIHSDLLLACTRTKIIMYGLVH
jgi:hypothetical protein